MNQQHPCAATEEQLLLLQACLLRGEPALQAWQSWKSRVDLDAVDAPSFALLPLLYHDLLALSVEDTDMGRLAGVARSAWAGNQLLFRAGASALAALRDAQIDALVADGTVLSLLHYEETGLRRLSSFEALVHLRDAGRAMEALSAAGWRMESLHAPRDTVIAFRAAARFEDGSGQMFRLCWRMWAGAAPDAESEVWDAARGFVSEGLSARALGPTDLLLRACAGPERWGREPSLLWVADGLAVLSTASAAVDWERFVARAQQLGLSLPAADALACLVEIFGAAVPAGVVRDLQGTPVSRCERTLWRMQAGGGAVWGALPWALQRYGRLMKGRSLIYRMGMFPRYLQCVWNLRSAWQVPIQALLKAAHGVGRGIRWRVESMTRGRR